MLLNFVNFSVFVYQSLQINLWMNFHVLFYLIYEIIFVSAYIYRVVVGTYGLKIYSIADYKIGRVGFSFAVFIIGSMEVKWKLLSFHFIHSTSIPFTIGYTVILTMLIVY